MRCTRNPGPEPPIGVEDRHASRVALLRELGPIGVPSKPSHAHVGRLHVRGVLMLCAVWLAAGSTAVGQAPEEDRGAPLVLGSGFTPDPIRVAGRTDSREPLNARAPGCRGYVGAGPDQVLQLDTRFGFLRLFVVAPRGVTLAVVGPDGRWRCSGEPLEGAPHEQGAFAEGRYEVWIGSHDRGVEVPYELSVTEFRSVTPLTGHTDDTGVISGGADLGLEVEATRGRYRDRRLRRGFLPDPREDGGRAGGELDVGLLGATCRGYVDPRPSHVLTLRTDFDYFRVQLGDSAGRATLVVRTPGGRFYCSAPENENAFIEQDAWPEGDYRIWVGATAEESRPEYRICYTETRPPAGGGTACGTDRLHSGSD